MVVLLNLIASLSLVAALGVPAVVSSQSEFDASSVSSFYKSDLNRHNSQYVIDPNVPLDYGYGKAYFTSVVFDGSDVVYDGLMDPVYNDKNLATQDLYGYRSPTSFAWNYYFDFSSQVVHLSLAFVDFTHSLSNIDSALVGYEFWLDGYNFFGETDFVVNIYSSDELETYAAVMVDLVYSGSSAFLLDRGPVRVLIAKSNLDYDSYLESKNIVPSITSGLGVVSNLASGLVGGFDSLALNNGALTNVMAFAFTLLGIGTAVGVAKLCFNWVTGRHGM